ncbi:contact-dependent growth inhibition system immunity protein [Streptomyces rhizosphaerihabitans]|uniref:contact-dependent growth inhibition system immunity protein n=1 Tax=Streptomyces rhizosphaerihabitans TaxID=1266770 RepID=UPI0021C1E711|nr:contact-dependent growth inhibition system immunity protein [Streptomyces rhizosphaerihabitans]MCT9009398.1 contact-dependent growth inhibition system immunity protein [Streptomyces rhizosphaerihabitans]
MPEDLDRGSSVEELEGLRWPVPPADSTPMVRNVYELRRRPVATLEPHELARLIGQDVGLRWLLPLAVEILRSAAPKRAEGGWFDDDLLYAVVTRKPEVWAAAPEPAHELRETVAALTDVSRHVRQDIDAFLAALPKGDA